MDWIEEKAEKLKEYLKNISLVRSLICYLCITSIGAVALWLFTRNICDVWMQVIGMRIQNIHYYDLDMGGKLFVSQSKKYGMILKILSVIYNNSFVIYMFIAYVIAGKVFWTKKLYPALETISDMLSALNAGDYSREIVYHSGDEMGRIGEGMEELRKKLIREKCRQWEQQEEQRNINAAFAHDMRTPLTVIRGYTEFLQKYVPQGKVSQELLMEKLDTMKYQEERLLRFSNTMTELQRIEKREISCKWMKFYDLQQRLKESMEVMEQMNGKTISICTEQETESKEKQQEIFADCECIQEVVENLLNNAVRYARQHIVVQLEIGKRELIIYVKDDGPGFSQKALRIAAQAYFSEEKDSSEHFGIGLSICKILCENHNGNLTFQNSIKEGAIAAATFGIGVR
ncbi:HAMP domain-containing sensor histidine kinase [Roseburia sp. 499]|uniref:HAMP domain-containing sensor histidine kinase n=1 Tax=Roseburia sp. 499 TaxID=1261634 RepID=UPI0009511486|nr:HAMP domain-containing sensor histidine kinase [Roseburia sp. 499]WVK68792.1 HAMP domain-containing sensor histidine kinase [Roseburia sp. 499]